MDKSDDYESFYGDIEFRSLDKVKRFVENHPYDKNFYYRNNESAAAMALKCKSIDVYNYLVSKGICLSPEENMDELVHHLSDEMKIRLSEIHRQYFKDPNLKHLTILNSKSKLSHETSTSERKECLEMISNAFEDLNSFKWIEPTLKIVSTCPDLSIAFDFNRDSVAHMDPMKQRSVSGTTYPGIARILIGASGLKSQKLRCAVLGTLIHELTHYAMKMVYDNGCKPYKIGNEFKQQEYEVIVDECEMSKDSENLIKQVFTYPQHKWEAELIVRVPQLLALYKDDEDSFFEVSGEFSELFDFYEQSVLADFKLAVPLLEARHGLKEVNELCGTLLKLISSEISLKPEALNFNLNANERVLKISSNCIKLTMRAIYQQLRTESNFDSSFIFTKLKTLKNQKIFDLVMNSFKKHQPTLIIECEDCDDFDVIAQQFRDHKMKEKMIFVTNRTLNFQAFEVLEIASTCDWSQLTAEYQDKLLKRQMIFKGRAINIGDVVTSIDDEPTLVKLIKKQKIQVGEKEKFSDGQFFVERQFLRSPACKLDLCKVLELSGEQQNPILISAEPGKGKSVILRKIADELSEKLPSRWVVFIELKSFCDIFQKYEKTSTTFDEQRKISRFFIEKILKKEKFDAEVFEKIFNAAGCIFLFDGLDEIFSTHKKFVMNLMTGIQETKNQIWISTRPHLTEEMKAVLNPLLLHIQPLSNEDRNDLLMDFFKQLNFKGECLTRKLREVENFLASISFKDNPITNPSLLKIIAEISQDYSNFTLGNANLFSTFNQLTSKLMEKCMNKGPEGQSHVAKQVGTSMMVDFYEKIAIETNFNFSQNDLESLFGNIQTPSIDDSTRVGLLYFDDSPHFKFVHRSFAEFFIAKFAFEVIFKKTFASNSHLKSTLKGNFGILLYLLFNNSQRYKTILMFIDDALKLLDSVNGEERSEILRIFFKRIFRDSNCFPDLVAFGCINLIECISTHYNVTSGSYWLKTNNDGHNVLMSATRHHSIKFVEKFWTLVKQKIKRKSIKKMFFEKTNSGENILHIAAQNEDEKVLEYVMIEITALTSDESESISHSWVQLKVQKPLGLKNLLLGRDNDGKNFLFHILSGSSKVCLNMIEILKRTLKNEDLGELLTSTDEIGSNVLQIVRDKKKFSYVCKTLKEIFSENKFCEFLLQKNALDETAFHSALKREDAALMDLARIVYVEALGEGKMTEILTAKVECKSILIYIMNHCQEILEIFWINLQEWLDEEKLRSLLLAVDSEGHNAISYAILNSSLKLFQVLWSSVEKLLPEELQKEILLRNGEFEKSAICYSMMSRNLETFNSVKNLYLKFFGRIKTKEMVLKFNVNGENILFYIIKNKEFFSADRIVVLLGIIEKLHQDEDKNFIIFLLTRNKDNATVFKIANDNNFYEILEKLKNLLVEKWKVGNEIVKFLQFTNLSTNYSNKSEMVNFLISFDFFHFGGKETV